MLLRIDLARIGAFAERWGSRKAARSVTDEDEHLRMEADDPFADTVDCRLIANGKALIPLRRDAAVFNPCPGCLPVSTPEADTLLDGYGCDTRFGWYIVRTSFGWATRKKPALHSLSLTLERRAQLLPGVHFTVRYPGQHFFFANPVTGTEHQLTVLGCAPDDRQPGERMHLSCTLSPELSAREVCIRDSRSPLPGAEVFDDGLLVRREQAGQQTLHEAFSEPGTNPDASPDWQLFFLRRNAAPISVILMDGRRTFGEEGTR